jgi:hypothetical protein
MSLSAFALPLRRGTSTVLQISERGLGGAALEVVVKGEVDEAGPKLVQFKSSVHPVCLQHRHLRVVLVSFPFPHSHRRI